MELETDYLIIGAGASGMAYADALLQASPDVDCLLVDRRHAPGGHWLDAYPFVRLHQPSANYGVSSRPLGGDRIDQHGPNAGFYERATGAEICDYFHRVLHDQLLPSGRARFLGMTEHVGSDDGVHRLVSLATGEEHRVRVRRRVVDATYVESAIPSRHRPSFGVDGDTTVIPPNALVHLGGAPSGFTVLGGGKTAMDTCGWLLDQGVDPGRITWVRPRELWLFDRAKTQPLELVAAYMQLQASWVRAAATATDPLDFARRLEDDGVFVRLAPDRDASVFRGATISQDEVAALRTIEDIVRARVQHVGASSIRTDAGVLPNDPGRVVVDCTAAGLPTSPSRPVFEADRTTLQYVTLGYLCWSAALLAVVEAAPISDAERNALCPPVPFSGRIDDVLLQAHASMQGLVARSGVPEIARWNDASRLNPAAGFESKMGEPAIAEALGVLGEHAGQAFRNLNHLAPLQPA